MPEKGLFKFCVEQLDLVLIVLVYEGENGTYNMFATSVKTQELVGLLSIGKEPIECISAISSSLDLDLLNLQTAETTLVRNVALQLRHTLLVTRRVLRLPSQGPLEVLIGIVGLKVGAQDAKPLAVVGDLLPVALDILEVLAEVREAPLEDLAVELRAHDGLEVDVLEPGPLGLLDHKVGGALDGAQERADPGRVLGDEPVVADVQDGAEAAAAQLGQLVDAQHLHVALGAALGREPLLELDHLHVLEADAGVDLALDDGLGHVHAAADCGVVGGRHPVVGGQLVDLDLAELADVSDALALEGLEVRGDAGRLEVDDTGEGLVEETANGRDREVAGFGLRAFVSNLVTCYT